MVRDARTSCLAETERGDDTSNLNVWSCGRGDTSRSADTLADPGCGPACGDRIKFGLSVEASLLLYTP
jgi:hypothetical protein